MLMIPSALSRVFATICIIFGFVLLAIIRKGYEEYWHLDDADKEKYHELMALLMALNNDDFWGGQEDEKSTFDFMQFSSTFDDGADCTGDNESSYGTGMFKKSHIKISQVDKLCG